MGPKRNLTCLATLEETAKARELYRLDASPAADDDIWIQEDPLVDRTSDDSGYWIQAWLWVPNATEKGDTDGRTRTAVRC